MSDRPNILLLLNDHQAYYRHGWDGGPKPQRPHFDRLAAGGVSFSRAYTACPLCMPVRRTMLTGVFPHKHRLLHNDENQVPAPYEMYFGRLAERGYRNYYYGKWHAGPPGSARDHGCEGFSYASFGNPYATREYNEYVGRRGLPPVEYRIERVFGMWFERLRAGDLYRGADGWPDGTGLTLTPKETHEAFFLAHLACDQLRENAKRGQPFAMRVDFWGPHHPHFPTQEFADRYNPEDIPEYGNFRDDLTSKPEIYRTERCAPLGRDRRLIQPSPLPWREWQKIIARVYASITMIDATGGLILDTLNELSLTDNTFVIWTADHGDALACHGGHFDKGSYMPEEMLRVPMAIRWPGCIQPGQVSDRLVSLLDVGPTFLNLAGTRFDHETDGTSLVDLCTGANAGWREDVMCETHGYGDDVLGRSIITDRYKYTATSGQMHELYDLQSDPYELTNLIDDPTYQDVRVDMQHRLAEWQQQTRDSRFVLE
ncbi:MAG: sulfatase-like hydrolase/transferase [Phycisphaerae bacterium]